jgi:hypothetical protein
MMPIQQCATCAQLDLMVRGQLPHMDRCQIINQFLKFMWTNRINFLRSTFKKIHWFSRILTNLYTSVEAAKGTRVYGGERPRWTFGSSQFVQLRKC